MDWLKFISSIVGSLAWPVTVLFTAFVLREPLKSLLITVSRLKYKELEVDFGKEIKELRKAADRAEIKKPFETEEQTKRTRAFSEEIENVAETSPSAAISLAWSGVESEIYAAINRLKISPDYPPYDSPYKNLMLMREHGDISTADFDVLNRMRRLRNEIVHSHVKDHEITVEEVQEYAYLAVQMVSKLQKIGQQATANTPTQPRS